MKRKVLVLAITITGILNPLTVKSIQEENSIKSGVHSEDKLKFVPDTSYSGNIVSGNDMTVQRPLDEIGPYVKQEEKKSNSGIYIICSAIILVIAIVLYIFRDKLKKSSNNNQ